MDKIRAILFGMTGLGNSALDALNEHDMIDLIAVFTTRRQEKPFPYYVCKHLYEAAMQNGIATYEGLNLKEISSLQLINKLAPDLIVVSTFPQIITKEIIKIPKLGVINIHPSLLPKYRGTTPTVWALINGEQETGVTVHFIEDERIDSGRIIVQNNLQISPKDVDGALRFRLAELSVTTLLKAIDLVLMNNPAIFQPQDESKATYFPKRTMEDAEIQMDKPFREILNRIKAMTPYPGAYIKHNNSKYYVKTAQLVSFIETINSIDNDFFDFITRDGKVRFYTGDVVCE